MSLKNGAFTISLPVDKTVIGHFTFVDKEKISWDQLYIEDGRAATIYGFSSIPQIFLFGPDGTLLKREGLRGEGIDRVLSGYLK